MREKDETLSKNQGRPRRVTAQDVAIASGVSRSAVSRAFTPGSYLDAEKRELILQTAVQIGYRPNAMAASLQGTKSNLVGVIAGDLCNPFDGEFLAALLGGLNSTGRWPLVIGGKDAVTDQSITASLSYPLDALIIRGGSVGPDVLENCEKLSIPVMFVGRRAAGPFTDSVTCDNQTAVATAVEMLIAKGRKHFGYIGGHNQWNSETERLQGVSDALSVHGLSLKAKRNADFTFEGGSIEAENLLKTHDIDALVCANDATALGALTVARQALGLSVPRDLSIIGFDDMSLARWPSFQLTTLQNPVDLMVAELLRLLEERIAKPDKPGEQVVLLPKLMLRQTH